MRVGFTLPLSVLIVSASCASYTARPMPVPKLEAMAVRQTERSISIGVDPFLDSERQKEVFGDHLPEQGVLPIQVFVQNQGNKPILLHATAVLVLPDETAITHKLPGVPSYGPPPQRSEFCENVGLFGGVMPGPQLLFLLGCGIFGAAREGNYQYEVARWEDYLSKELKSATLAKEISTHGFVFFEVPEEKRHFTDAILFLKFTEGEEIGGPEHTVRVPLSGLRFSK